MIFSGLGFCQQLSVVSSWCRMCLRDAETFNLGLRSDNNTASAWDFSGALLLPHSPLSASPLYPCPRHHRLHSLLSGQDPWGLTLRQVLILNPHEGPGRCWVLCGSCSQPSRALVGGNTYLQGPPRCCSRASGEGGQRWGRAVTQTSVLPIRGREWWDFGLRLVLKQVHMFECASCCINE